MRIAIVTESYLPQINGVTNSVIRVSEELRRRGHALTVIAPGRNGSHDQEQGVVRTPAFPLPGYREVRVGVAGAVVADALTRFQPDLIHLASPVALGAAALRLAREENIPALAVYQTDLPRYAATYQLPFGRPAAWRWLRRIHNRSDVTLAPSHPVASELVRRGFRRVRVWGRGVDTVRFDPRRRSHGLRRYLAPSGELIVGYVGRLSRDKDVSLLDHAHGIRGSRLVVVGDGPSRSKLAKRLPEAVFTGFLAGTELARTYASLDVLVHTGRFETFGQVIQEALSSGVPVLAPAAGGPLDLVRNGENGLFWPPSEPRLIRGLLEEMVFDRAAVASMAANARPSVEDRTWPKLVDELEQHYLSISYREHVAGPQSTELTAA